MTVKEGLLLARSHIAFIVGLLLAFAMIAKIEGWDWSASDAARDVRTAPEARLPERIFDARLRPAGVPDAELFAWAQTAWRYFESNTQPDTGLVNSVDQYPSTTLWDTGSYALGLLSAAKLGVIDDEEFRTRVVRLLDALEALPLVDGEVPNKAYDTRDLGMVDYDNSPAPEGIGWSAIDIGRVLVPLQVLVWRHPEHTAQVLRIVGRWNFDRIVIDGVMYGAARDEQGRLERLQEGRLGYEEYAAKAFGLFGLDVSGAVRYDDFLEVVDIEGVEIATDSRDHSTFDAHNYVVSESYVLDGLEFGFDRHSWDLAVNVFEAQRRRYERTGVLTAVSETHLNRAPYFVYNTVFANGKRWNTITEANEDASDDRTLSTKAALGWYVLMENEYADRLRSAVSELRAPERGFYSGRYEADGAVNDALTANTNALVLESLAYHRFGPMLRLSGRPAAPESRTTATSDVSPPASAADVALDAEE